MQDMVYAFAEKAGVLRVEIAKVARSGKLLVSRKRTPRYSPFVVVHLIRRWLSKHPDCDIHARQGFEHVLRLLKP